MKPVKVVTVTFVYVGGRECLNFAVARKWRRTPAPEELLTQPKLLSDWAVQAGLLDRGIEVAEDDLEGAIALREAIYRTVTARLEGRRPKSADIELLNEHGSHAQLTPRLDRTGAVRRVGTSSQLLARLAADLLDLLAGPDIEKVKRCAHPGCSRLYVDSSRAQNRHWCGMGTCGNKAKVRALRERQRASESGVAGVSQSRTKA
jgi:predicted RNA-binding Zn ribbon-like protein